MPHYNGCLHKRWKARCADGLWLSRSTILQLCIIRDHQTTMLMHFHIFFISHHALSPLAYLIPPTKIFRTASTLSTVLQACLASADVPQSTMWKKLLFYRCKQIWHQSMVYSAASTHPAQCTKRSRSYLPRSL